MTSAAKAICMVASAYESFFRVVIAPGEIVLRHTRLFRIAARLSKSLARVRDLATGREEILAELICGIGEGSSRLDTLASKYEVSRSTIYRWISRYRDVAAPSSLIPLPRGIANSTIVTMSNRPRPHTVRPRPVGTRDHPRTPHCVAIASIFFSFQGRCLSRLHSDNC